MGQVKKTKYLLDSDVSIWIMRGNEKIIDLVSKLTGNSPAVISILTVAEIYKNSLAGEENSNRRFFELHHQLPIDLSIARIAGEYWQKYRSINSNIVDYLIAATCKIHKLTLLTRNTKHFPMKDIKVINPVQ